MNYCIFNGKKSTMVKGLMIQALPPITKPLMRTRIKEIDGRDGDIVTKLGYSAYDREMSVGLFGDFDIDEIIDYFNSDGEAIFSNELDKKYNYQILNQIDYERLGRFKQGKVVFRVQPFKYPSVDDSFTATTTKLFFLTNRGNVYAKPLIYIYGCSGTVTISINDAEQMITISNPTSSDLLIDTEKMNAYYLSGGYANRVVTANYSNIKFNAYSKTKIFCGGSYTQIVFKNISRWI